MNVASFILIALSALMGAIEKPMAYLDPGTGSFLLQILAAGVLGGLFVLRASWSKVRDFFLHLFGKEVETPDDEE